MTVFAAKPKLSEKQKELLKTIAYWPGRFPIHVSELRSGEHSTADSLHRLSLIQGRCSLRLTEAGRTLLREIKEPAE